MPLLGGADEVSAVVVSVTLLVVSLQKLATVVFPYRRERGGYANTIKCCMFNSAHLIANVCNRHGLTLDLPRCILSMITV